jgi:dGTPase
VFQRDRDRIIHSKAFRRLDNKTQVFMLPPGDHYRNRLTHTLEVSQIARTIARGLRLNEDLTEAIALGHDLGHTPFGHSGEKVLNALMPGGFLHNEQSLRVVDELEGEGGLNLTYEVRDGILCHTGARLPATWEGRVVRFSDRIAYINHDIDDALRAGLITVSDLPRKALNVLGYTHGDRISTAVTDMILTSQTAGEVAQSLPVANAMNLLREFMFRNVYISPAAKQFEAEGQHMIASLYRYYIDNPKELPQPYGPADPPVFRRAADYIAGMTDTFCRETYEKVVMRQ